MMTLKEAFQELDNINEKWYHDDDFYDPIWWSDSVYEFRNFIKEAVRTKKDFGYRLIIGDGSYAVAEVSTMGHECISDFLDNQLLPVGEEYSCLGIPTLESYDVENFETVSAYDTYLDDFESFCYIYCDDDESKFPTKRDMTLAEFTPFYTGLYNAEKTNRIICDGFELDIPRSYKPMKTVEQVKQSATVKALGDLVKEIRM